jgi:IclR family mhp operon transcriptional activator
MAVPVFENGRILATLGFTWITAAMTVEQARERYLPCLNQMSQAISRTLDTERPAIDGPIERHPPADDEWHRGYNIRQSEREIEHAQ